MGWEDLVRNVQGHAARTFRKSNVVWKPKGGADFDTLDAVYRDAGVIVDLGLIAKLASDQPRISFREADLPQPLDSEDQVQVDGVLYNLGHRERDGEGMVALELHEA